MQQVPCRVNNGRRRSHGQGKPDGTNFTHLQHSEESFGGSARSIQASAHDMRELSVDGALLLGFGVHRQQRFPLSLHLRTACSVADTSEHSIVSKGMASTWQACTEGA